MKKASSIISHIRLLPQFKTLRKHYCYQKFISLFSPRCQKGIAFLYIRQETLFIAVSHPWVKMELNYKQDLLKTLLSMLKKQEERCKSIKVSKIIVFNAKSNRELENNQDTVPYYSEKSLGDFIINSDDKELKEAFEKIRDSIENQI